MSFRKNFLLWLFCLCFVVISGCASASKGVEVDKSFTEQAMNRGGIGVGGVISVSLNLAFTQQKTFAKLLRQATTQRYPKVRVIPMEKMVGILGVQSYQAMMQYYRMDEEVPSNMLVLLRRQLPHTRYLVFARIGNERMFHHALGGRHYETPVVLRIHLDVYDLETRKIVWKGSLQNKMLVHDGYESSLGKTKRWEEVDSSHLIGEYGNAFVEDHHEYPTSPEFMHFVQGMFERLLKEFPKTPQIV